MSLLSFYLNYCQRFSSINLPEFSFKKINESYNYYYKLLYDINKEDIDKATFFTSILILSLIFSFSLMFTSYNVLVIMAYSFLISLLISYQFNVFIYNKVKKLEIKINAYLNLIKIDFSLSEKTFEKERDLCVYFILRLLEYNLPIKSLLKKALREILEGRNPELILKNLISPSEDLNKFIKKLLSNQFRTFNELDLDDNYSESRFKIYIREIETKMSIIFFIGIFLPIGLCFFILFLPINYFYLVLFIPFYFLILNYLFKKLIRINFYLIGLLNYASIREKQKFDEFLAFLRIFAINLKNQFPPEVAFIKSYQENRFEIKILKKIFEDHISKLLNYSLSFADLLNSMEIELKSIHLQVLIDSIKKMIRFNSYESAEKIFDVLNMIKHYRSLEKKLEVLIKAEKFKVFIFLFLLPIVLGAIGGMIPFFGFLTNNLLEYELGEVSYISIVPIDVLLTFTTLLLSNSLTSFYFLKIVNMEKNYTIFFTNIIFILSFLLSFFNILGLA